MCLWDYWQLLARGSTGFARSADKMVRTKEVQDYTDQISDRASACSITV